MMNDIEYNKSVQALGLVRDAIDMLLDVHELVKDVSNREGGYTYDTMIAERLVLTKATGILLEFRNYLERTNRAYEYNKKEVATAYKNPTISTEIG